MPKMSETIELDIGEPYMSMLEDIRGSMDGVDEKLAKRIETAIHATYQEQR